MTYVLVALVLLFLLGYLVGRRKRKVTALSVRESFVRFYPNPGIGFVTKRTFVQLSLKRGFEIFTREAPGKPWRLSYAAVRKTVRRHRKPR